MVGVGVGVGVGVNDDAYRSSTKQHTIIVFFKTITHWILIRGCVKNRNHSKKNFGF